MALSKHAKYKRARKSHTSPLTLHCAKILPPRFTLENVPQYIASYHSGVENEGLTFELNESLFRRGLSVGTSLSDHKHATAKTVTFEYLNLFFTHRFFKGVKMALYNQILENFFKIYLI